MPYGEADTRARLIDQAIHARGWTEDLIRRDETAGALEDIHGRRRKRAKGRFDYASRVKVDPDTQPIAVMEGAPNTVEAELDTMSVLPAAGLRRAFTGENLSEVNHA